MREALLTSLSNTDPEFIEQKLAEETDIDLIASLVKRLVRSKRREEPEAALALLEQYSDIDSYAASMRGVASRWGRRNPEEMLAYVIDNPDVKGLVNSVNLVTSSWYQKRPEEVLQWLDSVTRQDVKDKGFTGIAEAMANQDPAAALEVTESISEDRRENVRVQIVTGWVMKNTSRMEEILSQVKLSDEGQACVRRYIPSL
jgi:hypothetical protein